MTGGSVAYPSIVIEGVLDVKFTECPNERKPSFQRGVPVQYTGFPAVSITATPTHV
jgi:hypothetical protein